MLNATTVKRLEQTALLHERTAKMAGEKATRIRELVSELARLSHKIALLDGIARKNGRVSRTESVAPGKGSRQRRFTAEQVLDIRRKVAAGEKQYVLAKKYGVHYTTLHTLARGKTYRWVR